MNDTDESNETLWRSVDSSFGAFDACSNDASFKSFTSSDAELTSAMASPQRFGDKLEEGLLDALRNLQIASVKKTGKFLPPMALREEVQEDDSGLHLEETLQPELLAQSPEAHDVRNLLDHLVHQVDLTEALLLPGCPEISIACPEPNKTLTPEITAKSTRIASQTPTIKSTRIPSRTPPTKTTTISEIDPPIPTKLTTKIDPPNAAKITSTIRPKSTKLSKTDQPKPTKITSKTQPPIPTKIPSETTKPTKCTSKIDPPKTTKFTANTLPSKLVKSLPRINDTNPTKTSGSIPNHLNPISVSSEVLTNMKRAVKPLLKPPPAARKFTKPVSPVLQTRSRARAPEPRAQPNQTNKTEKALEKRSSSLRRPPTKIAADKPVQLNESKIQPTENRSASLKRQVTKHVVATVVSTKEGIKLKEEKISNFGIPVNAERKKKRTQAIPFSFSSRAKSALSGQQVQDKLKIRDSNVHQQRVESCIKDDLKPTMPKRSVTDASMNKENRSVENKLEERLALEAKTRGLVREIQQLRAAFGVKKTMQKGGGLGVGRGDSAVLKVPRATLELAK